ncbi:MAG: tungstate transport system permease protein, partial [Thermoproteota archaeon]|nr:tungstate transport system permease protein [Thermoproteota archaeon]
CNMVTWQEYLWNGLTEAVRLIFTGDHELVEITLRTLQISFYAILLAIIIGIPIGVVIGMKEFPGKKFVKIIFTALIGVPTVSLGLLLFLLFVRNGPFGYLDFLYTIQGISVGEALLVVPIVVSFVTSAVESTDVKLRDLARTLGASELDTSIAVVREALEPMILAIVAAFNRAFAELGIAMMIGGNIAGYTRVLTTAISLQTNLGDIPLSIALSIILMLVVFALTVMTRNIGALVNFMRSKE